MSAIEYPRPRPPFPGELPTWMERGRDTLVVRVPDTTAIVVWKDPLLLYSVQAIDPVIFTPATDVFFYDAADPADIHPLQRVMDLRINSPASAFVDRPVPLRLRRGLVLQLNVAVAFTAPATAFLLAIGVRTY